MTLYSKSICSICTGLKKSWYGYGCPYCDDAGHTFLEATHKKIEKCVLEELPEDVQRHIYEQLRKRFEMP
jgi:hypothetical protein